MSYLQFIKNGTIHTDKLTGDNDLHIFDQRLTDVYLDKYDELIGHQVTYDDIIAIQIFKNDDNITRLPNNLKYLYIKSGTLQELPINDAVAANLEVIFLDFTNLNTFPDISRCTKLRELTINHSNITRLTPNYTLPSSLKILNLRYNNINEIDCSLFRNNPQLKINLSYNNLTERSIDTLLGINRSADIKMQGRYQFKRITHQNYNAVEIRNFMGNIQLNNNNNDNNTIAGNVLQGNTQTVHLSSINKTILTSYNNILKYIDENKLWINRDPIDEIEQAFIKQKILPIPSPFLKEQKGLKDRHSLLSLSYIELLGVIWTVVKNHPQKENLIERLHSEITDSFGKCFTGRINRLVNVLVGYVDGVIVSISLKEEIQMSIQRVMNKFTALFNDKTREDIETRIIDFKNARDEIFKILNEKYDVDTSDPNNIISEDYKNSWLSALQDYRPNAVLCKFDEKVRITDDVDRVNGYYYISYDDQIYASEQSFDEEDRPIGKISDKKQYLAHIYAYEIEYDNIKTSYPEKYLNYYLV